MSFVIPQGRRNSCPPSRTHLFATERRIEHHVINMHVVLKIYEGTAFFICFNKKNDFILVFFIHALDFKLRFNGVL